MPQSATTIHKQCPKARISIKFTRLSTALDLNSLGTNAKKKKMPTALSGVITRPPKFTAKTPGKTKHATKRYEE
ncbi:hypothetical protein NBRC116585_26180 [Thalassolituus maritimus]|uniref:Uncharacterized protein n=1 Tax=Thalassolituus maritimus TaxID=484498 RepID=A0ABQ0A264_9GAMM